MSDIVERLRKYSLFLNGEASIGAAWFGDTADGERGRFWWRKQLPLNQAAAEITALRAEIATLKASIADEREDAARAMQEAMLRYPPRFGEAVDNGDGTSTVSVLQVQPTAFRSRQP